MLCSTCPKRATCKSVCADLNRELVRVEVPQRESTKSPEQLERIELKIAERTFFGDSFDYGEDSGPLVPKLLIDRDRLSAALEQLTPRQQECLKLCFWEGLSKKDIAQRLNLARSTVVHHIATSLELIRGHYLIGTVVDIDTSAPIVGETQFPKAS